jgi:hypothetical protein
VRALVATMSSVNECDALSDDGDDSTGSAPSRRPSPESPADGNHPRDRNLSD